MYLKVFCRHIVRQPRDGSIVRSLRQRCVKQRFVAGKLCLQHAKFIRCLCFRKRNLCLGILIGKRLAHRSNAVLRKTVYRLALLHTLPDSHIDLLHF